MLRIVLKMLREINYLDYGKNDKKRRKDFIYRQKMFDLFVS